MITSNHFTDKDGRPAGGTTHGEGFAIDTADSETCQRCRKEPAAEPHSCPFAEDIHGDSESLCNCCDDCSHECAMDI